MRKRIISLLLAIVMCLSAIPVASAAGPGDARLPDSAQNSLTEEQLETIAEQSKKDKANVILTNDGECDDMDSMLRYLNYANEFNTKAVIISSSTYHWAGGTIIDPKTRQPAEYDEEVHGTKDVDPFEYDPTPEDPDNGDEYQALRYLQSRWTGMAWYDHFYDGYEEAYETLKAYDDSYPSPDELRDVTYVGNIKYKGEMLEETEGSVAIEDLILNNPDGEPLYVLLWGGCNTVARALKSIEEDYRDTEDWDRIYNKICDEVVFYMILNQDNTYADYISKNWPDTKFVHNSGQFWSFAYMKSRTPEEYYDDVFSKTWSDTIAEIGSPLLTTYLLNASGWDLRHIGEDVETNPGNETNPFYTWNNTEDTEAFYNPDKNPYNAWAGDEAVVATWGESENRGSAEPVHQDCKVCCVNEDGSKKTNATKGEQDYFISEGDSPSFFFLLNNGLRSNEDPTWGGWGGRFVQESDRYWTDKGCADWNPYSQKEDSVYPQTRWFPDIQEDFSARAQWTVTEDGNRNPMSGVMNGLDLTAEPGETLTLNGVAYDPNGDGLSYKWWQYFEVDTYDGELDSKLEMSGADTKDLTVTIPEDAEDGDTIHLIFEAKDDNELPMKAYKRVVITVEDDAQGGGGSSSSSSRFSITVTQSEGGTIAPSSATVAKGGSKTFTITADEGWQIADVLVDGKSVGAVSSYTFKNVTEKHTITAMFEPMEGAAGVAGFIDVKASDWFAGAVEYVVNGGLMNGTSKTTFSPMGDTTRGMIVTILYRQAGSPEVESDQSNWWSDARVWAMANGVSDGTNMEKPITREQLAAMLYRYAKLTGEDISGRASLESFQDAGKVSSYAVEALQWNVAEGIVTGKTGGVIDPQAGATRAEAATMFMRFCELTK